MTDQKFALVKLEANFTIYIILNSLFSRTRTTPKYCKEWVVPIKSTLVSNLVKYFPEHIAQNTNQEKLTQREKQLFECL